MKAGDMLVLGKILPPCVEVYEDKSNVSWEDEDVAYGRGAKSKKNLEGKLRVFTDMEYLPFQNLKGLYLVLMRMKNSDYYSATRCCGRRNTGFVIDNFIKSDTGEKIVVRADVDYFDMGCRSYLIPHIRHLMPALWNRIAVNLYQALGRYAKEYEKHGNRRYRDDFEKAMDRCGILYTKID